MRLCRCRSHPFPGPNLFRAPRVPDLLQLRRERAGSLRSKVAALCGCGCAVGNRLRSGRSANGVRILRGCRSLRSLPCLARRQRRKRRSTGGRRHIPGCPVCAAQQLCPHSMPVLAQVLRRSKTAVCGVGPCRRCRASSPESRGQASSRAVPGESAARSPRDLCRSGCEICRNCHAGDKSRRDAKEERRWLERYQESGPRRRFGNCSRIRTRKDSSVRGCRSTGGWRLG